MVSVPPSAAPRGALPVGARSPPPGSVTPRLAPGCTEPRPRAGGSPRAEPRSSECDARLTTIDGVEDEERKPLMRCEALEAAAAGARAACGQRLGAAAAASVRPAERERGAARRGAGCAAPPPPGERRLQLQQPAEAPRQACWWRCSPRPRHHGGQDERADGGPVPAWAGRPRHLPGAACLWAAARSGKGTARAPSARRRPCTQRRGEGGLRAARGGEEGASSAAA